MSACEGCGSAVLDAPNCTGCARRLELALGDVPALIADLETVLAKLTVYADQAQRVTGSKADEEIVPFHIAAGAAREHLHAILSTWCRLVHREKFGGREAPLMVGPVCEGCGMFAGPGHWSCVLIRKRWRPLPPDKPSAMSGWLLHEVEWLRHHGAGSEAIDEITDAVHRVRKVLDAPAGRTTDPLGPCPHPACNGEIRAYLPRDPDVMCHADCTAEPEHTWDSTQFLGLGRRMLRPVGDVA